MNGEFPQDWYWIVGGDEARAFSSAAAAYVPASDPSYVAWANGNFPSRIADEAELANVLATYGLPTGPLPPALPPEIPMYKVKKYMALVKAQTAGATDYHAQVMDYIDALPEPARTMARIDFGPSAEQIGSPNLVVASGLAQGARAALGLSESDYATLLAAANALA